MSADAYFPFDMPEQAFGDGTQSAQHGPLEERHSISMRRAKPRSTKRRSQTPQPPVWDGPEYRVYPSGIYDVRVNDLQGPQWLKNYQRWSLRVECNFLTEKGDVSGFLNLGGDPERPGRPGRQSNFFKVWCMANGGPPRRGQTMDWNDLLGKFFRVRIETAAKNGKGQSLSPAERYSKVVEFLECIGP